MYRTVKRVLIEDKLNIGSFTISDVKKYHHLVNVMRLKHNDDIRVFNHQDGEWLGKISDINKKCISFDVYKKIKDVDKSSGIILAFAPIKQDKLKILIEKATEIGVDGFIPVITARTIARDSSSKKLDSYLVSAVEQSERITRPSLQSSCKLKDFLDKYNKHSIIFCNEDEEQKLMSDIDNKDQYIILVGPEGGFTKEEKNLLAIYPNVVSIKLSSNILRAETAAIVALSNLMITIGK